MQSTHISYEVPSGASVLAFDTDTPLTSAVANLRFVFGGKQTIRITRILGRIYNAPDITFADAAPHEVTVYFAQNPIPHSNPDNFLITVENLSATSEPLRVTALYEWSVPLDPPPGI